MGRCRTKFRLSRTFFKEVLTKRLPDPESCDVARSRAGYYLPRDAHGPRGDEVEVRATASGGVYIEKPGRRDAYKARLYALAERRPIRGITTDELMEMLRGEGESSSPKKR
jgi:antitoxin PrlF